MIKHKLLSSFFISLLALVISFVLNAQVTYAQTCATSRVVNDWYCSPSGNTCLQWASRCSSSLNACSGGAGGCPPNEYCATVCVGGYIDTPGDCLQKSMTIACSNVGGNCWAMFAGNTCRKSGNSCDVGGNGTQYYECWVNSGPAPSGGGGTSGCVSGWCTTTSECTAIGGTTGTYPGGSCQTGTVACCPPSSGGGWTPNCAWDTDSTGYPQCNLGEGNACNAVCQVWGNNCAGSSCAPGLEGPPCFCPACRPQCTPACGQPSGCGNTCPSTDLGAPAAITGLNPADGANLAYNPTNNTVTISWNAANLADRYDFELIPVTGSNLSCSVEGAYCTYASNYTGVGKSFAIIPTSQLFSPLNGGNVGNGLQGYYYNNKTLTGAPALQRIDRQLNINWQTGPYVSGSSRNDAFSVRWVGKVLAPVTGTYTFRIGSDDGVRLFVNNQQLTPNTAWSNHTYATYTANMDLTAGQKYDIRVEYYDNTSTARVTLEWLTPVDQNDGLTTNSYTFTPTYGEYLYRIRAYNNSCSTPGQAGAWSNFTRFYVTAPISGTVYADPNNQATLVGGNCTLAGATAQRPGSGTSVSLQSARGTSSSLVQANGTYTVNNGAFGGPNTVTLLPGTSTYTCTCPAGCVYSGVGAPLAAGLNFFISDSRDPWWQTSNGLVYAAQANGTAVSTKVPPTCNGSCTPALAARDQYGTQNSSGFVLTGGGGIVTSSDQNQPLQYLNQDARTDRAVNTQANGPREDYAYFSQLYSIGTNDTTDFTGAKPSSAPANGRAYYSNGSVTINNPWTVASGESMVVFVNGNLTVNQPITVDQNGFLAFIVNGDITFGNTLGWNNLNETKAVVAGVFIADGQIVVASNPGNDLKFVGEGSFVGWGGVDLNREYTPKSNNNLVPAETFRFRPDFMVNVPERMTRPIYLWQETN